MRAEIATLTVLGVPVAALDVDTALGEVSRLLREPGPAMLTYVNAHSLNLAAHNDAYRRLLCAADLVLNDGSGLALAARTQGARFPDNLNGTDFTPRLLTIAAAFGAPVFLLGGRPGVAERAAVTLGDRIPGLKIVGHADGYFDAEQEPALLARIRSSGARVLLVGMGSPRQERWLAARLDATGARLGVAVGAFLDFAAGAVPRAPRWLRKIGCEWVYRLLLEPARLWRRYVLGNPAFLIRVVAERLGLGRFRGTLRESNESTDRWTGAR